MSDNPFPVVQPGAIGSYVWPGALKTLEECGELAQVLGKLLAFPDGEHPDGEGPLTTRLENEIADIRAATDYLIAVNRLDSERIALREKDKLARFEDWHLKERNPDALPGTCGKLPPHGGEGWAPCSREAGHDGPCAHHWLGGDTLGAMS